MKIKKVKLGICLFMFFFVCIFPTLFTISCSSTIKNYTYDYLYKKWVNEFNTISNNNYKNLISYDLNKNVNTIMDSYRQLNYAYQKEMNSDYMELEFKNLNLYIYYFSISYKNLVFNSNKNFNLDFLWNLKIGIQQDGSDLIKKINLNISEQLNKAEISPTLTIPFNKNLFLKKNYLLGSWYVSYVYSINLNVESSNPEINLLFNTINNINRNVKISNPSSNQFFSPSLIMPLVNYEMLFNLIKEFHFENRYEKFQKFIKQIFCCIDYYSEDKLGINITYGLVDNIDLVMFKNLAKEDYS